jgi:protein-tyrosine-phosphatase
MKRMKVLMVCTGNLCRSPMAMGFMRHVLAARGCDDIEVSSAGTLAQSGSPATDHAIAVARREGIDLSHHRSKPLAQEELLGADLVVAMAREHVTEIERLAPQVRTKVVLLKELAELDVGESGDGADATRRLETLLEARRADPDRLLDVEDPIGGPISLYERSAAEIARAVEVLVDALCGKPAVTQEAT